MKSLATYIAEQRSTYRTIDRDFDALVELEMLGAAVYRARRAAGLTQRDLAEAAGANVSWVAAVEAGRRLPASCSISINELLWPIRHELEREGVSILPPSPETGIIPRRRIPRTTAICPPGRTFWIHRSEASNPQP